MTESLVTMFAVILSAALLVPISAQAGSTTNTAAETGHAIALHHRHNVRTTRPAAQSRKMSQSCNRGGSAPPH
jgi:hypothetical protein